MVRYVVNCAPCRGHKNLFFELQKPKIQYQEINPAYTCKNFFKSVCSLHYAIKMGLIVVFFDQLSGAART